MVLNRSGRQYRAVIGTGEGYDAADIVSSADIAIGGAGNENVVRIQQPGAALSCGREQIGKTVADIQIFFPGGLDKTAIATECAAARADRAIGARSIIGPNDDFSAITTVDRIGRDARLGADISELGITNIVVLALVIPTHQRLAATGSPKPKATVGILA